MRVVAVVVLALLIALVVADDSAAVLTADQKIAVKEARRQAIAKIIEQQQQQAPESIPKEPVFRFVGNDKPNTVDGASFVGKDGVKSIPFTGASFVGKNGVRRIRNRLTKPIFSYVKSDTKVQSVVKRVSFKANANVKQLVTDIKPQLEQATGFEFAQTTPVSFTKKRLADGTEYAVKVQIGDNKFTRVVIHKNKTEKIGRLRSAKLLQEKQVAKTMGAAAVLSGEDMGAAAVLAAPVHDTINFADLVAKTPKRAQRRGGRRGGKGGKKNSKKTKNVKKAVNKTIKKSKKRANTLTRKLATKPTVANAEKLKAIVAAIKKNYHKKAAAVRKAYHTTEDESARKVLANQYNKLTINVAKIVDKAEHRLKGAKFHRKTLAAVKEGKQVIKKSVNRLSKAFHKHGLKLPKSARPQFRKLQNKIKKAQTNGAKVKAVKNAERKMRFAAKLGIPRVFNKAHRHFKKSLVAVKKEAEHAVLAVARSFKHVKAHIRKHKKSATHTLSSKKHKKSPRKEHKKKDSKKHGKKHAKKCYKLKSPKKHRKSAF